MKSAKESINNIASMWADWWGPVDPKISERRIKAAGWFAGSASGQITLKEWMDFLKNAALYGIIFSYSVLPGPKFETPIWGALVWIGWAAVIFIGLLLIGQGFSLVLLTWTRGQSFWSKGFRALAVAFSLLGIIFGLQVYFANAIK